MRRPQFTLKTMLWSAFSMAMFLGGMAVQRQLDKPLSVHTFYDPEGGEHQFMVMRGGAEWFRTVHKGAFGEADATPE